MAKKLPPGWEFDDGPSGKGSYSPSKFYTATVDGKGHGKTFTCQIPDYQHAMVLALREQFPQHYKSKHAVGTDSLHHRIVQLADLHDEIKASPEYKMYMELHQDEQRIEQRKILTQLPIKIREVCSGLRDDGDADGLRVYLALRTEAAESHPEPWRTKQLDELARWK